MVYSIAIVYLRVSLLLKSISSMCKSDLVILLFFRPSDSERCEVSFMNGLIFSTEFPYLNLIFKDLLIGTIFAYSRGANSLAPLRTIP